MLYTQIEQKIIWFTYGDESENSPKWITCLTSIICPSWSVAESVSCKHIHPYVQVKATTSDSRHTHTGILTDSVSSTWMFSMRFMYVQVYTCARVCACLLERQLERKRERETKGFVGHVWQRRWSRTSSLSPISLFARSLTFSKLLPFYCNFVCEPPPRFLSYLVLGDSKCIQHTRRGFLNSDIQMKTYTKWLCVVSIILPGWRLWYLNIVISLIFLYYNI